MQKSHFHVLIPASGQGMRFGGDKPKQYLPLNDKPVLRHTIEKFLDIRECASVTVIINPDHINLYSEATKGLNIVPPVHGCKTRKESVYKGLQSLENLDPTDKVLIHDAVRPFISHTDIKAVLNALDHHQAAALSYPVQDTLRRGEKVIDRTNMYHISTPQGFHYNIIKRAHENGQNLDVTDDTALVTTLGMNVELITGSKTNIKITTQDDLKMLEKLMISNNEIRTGTGFDVHQFTENRPLILCGIEIPHTHGLQGHSDADVAMHAITDALLGTIGEGDIGTHFPPSDPQYKDMDSSIFLEHTHNLIKEKNGIIQNIDLTIICEEPKTTPHAPKMRQNIAKILDIEENRINIKATTTEGLGFTGRKEGIAAQATATIKIQS